jgi:hypothetical protein
MASSRRAEFYVKWGAVEALRLEVGSDTLRVIAENADIVLEPRMADINAKYSYKKEVEDSNRKTLYIGLREPIKPLKAPRIDIVGRSYVGNFEVIYTDLDFEKYLTIITPASFLYDYVVLTTTEIMFHMIARRQVYFEEEPYDHIRVYFV